jgi:hypothetical protein
LCRVLWSGWVKQRLTIEGQTFAPFAGIIRIRFNGYDLRHSRAHAAKHHPTVSASIFQQSARVKPGGAFDGCAKHRALLTTSTQTTILEVNKIQ